MSDKVGSPLTLVGYEDDMDLRSISWNQDLLEQEAREYKLKHGEAVVYSNVAQTKVRLIAVFYGMAVLILPPIDPADKISLYLKVNQFLRLFKDGTAGVMIGHLDKEIAGAQERLERIKKRKALAAQAAKRRSK
jgi:hypothetical protein